MQPNFTLKKVNPLFVTRFTFFLFFLLSAQLYAQTIITTNYTTTPAAGVSGASSVTFVVTNNNSNPVILTRVDVQAATQFTSGNTTGSLWFTATSLSGAPTVAAPAWTLIATGTPVNVTADGVYTFLSGLTFSIPANTTYRFAFSSSNGILVNGAPNSPPSAPNTFTADGITLGVAGFQIAGANVGYVSIPTSSFNPYGFLGRLYLTNPACTGTPAPGNTISTSASVCPGVNFTLSLQNTTSGSGVTYQWQSSTDGTTWANISGATASTLVRNQTSETYYRCQVTCSGNTGNSSSLFVPMAPSSACYCNPTYSRGCTLGDAITRVSIPGTTLNNASTCSTPPFTYYSNVAAPSLIAGGTYTVNVSMGTDLNQYARIWVDWNQDGDFADAGEAAGASVGNAGANGTAAIVITVPPTALIGTTRMRVRGGDDVAILATQSCGASSSTYGEAEDYNVTIAPCVQGTFTTQPAAATATCGGNATFTVAASGSLPTYTWQFRTGPTAIWQALPNGGVVSGATTATLVLTDIPDSWNGREFRSLFSGACTGANPSNGAVLTVNRLAATTNVSSASICAGSSQMLSLTNSLATPTSVTFNATTGLPLVIPEEDFGFTGVSNSLTVSGIPAGSLITNVAVKFNINHTWVGDLVINIKAPNGQTLNLVNLLNNGGGGNSSDNFTNTIVDSLSTIALSGAAAPRTGTFRADRGTTFWGSPAPGVAPVTTTNWASLLSIMNGTWTLALTDTYDDVEPGVLTAWSIVISYVAPVFAQGTWTATPAVPNSMFTDAALTVPYTGTPATTIYVNPAVSTSYAVQFTTSTTPCTTAPRVIPVAVGLPITTLAIPATVSACIGSGFTLTGSHAAIPAANAAAIYQWQQSTDGGVNWTSISGATGIALSVSTTSSAMNGRRYRLLSQSGGCAIAVSNTSVLTINPLPTITLAAPATGLVPGRTVTITGTSSPIASANGWSWSLNGASVAGTSATQIVNVDGLGSYQATVRDINGCVNRSNVLVIKGDASDKLFIYPNPTAGAFQVRYYHAGDANEKRIISVYNPLGQLVATKTFDLTYSTAPYLRMDVDMSGAARGTYVVKVAHEYSGKVVSGLVLVQ
jgi:subtilisin-like proprotein convertase family protein